MVTNLQHAKYSLARQVTALSLRKVALVSALTEAEDFPHRQDVGLER